MKRVWSISLVTGAALLAMPLFTSVAVGQTSVFTFDFAGPTSFAGSAGAENTATYDCRLTQVSAPGDTAGAQGWSMGVTADNATILSITYAGTVSANKADGGKEDAGFADFQPTIPPTNAVTCPGGGAGVVSAVVLSFRKPITLAPDETHVVAKIDVMTTIPAGGGTATLRYLSGCEGAGEPVELAVTQTGQTVVPEVEPLDITLREVITCCDDGKANMGFSSARIASSNPYDGIIDNGDGLCSGSGGEIVVEVAPEAVGSTTVYANISSQNPSSGIQGWTMSIAESGDAQITEATTGGTSGAPKPDGLQDAGFESVEPGSASGRQGWVAAVVLSFRKPIVLPLVSTHSVLRLTVESKLPQGPEGSPDIRGDVEYFDNLEGSGEPVPNVVTVMGSTLTPCNIRNGQGHVDVVFRTAVKAFGQFIRGNPNDDAKVNVADPIWIINELFRSGTPTACQDAADANDDGLVDSSDATYLIGYLFQGLSAPPAPFPACGDDPTDDTGDADPDNDLPCPAGSSAQCP